MKRALVLILLLTAAACSSTTEAGPGASGSEIVLELGRRVVLDGTSITVGMQAVEDSRCPTTVLCIWAGNGRVTLDLRDTNGTQLTADLNTHPDLPRAVTFRYVRVELVALDPYPVYATANRVDYQAHLRWSYLPD